MDLTGSSPPPSPPLQTPSSCPEAAVEIIDVDADDDTGTDSAGASSRSPTIDVEAVDVDGATASEPRAKRRRTKASDGGGASSSTASNGSIDMHNSEALSQRALICPICQEEVKQVQATKCGHIFHKACIQQAIRVQHRCPICKKKLTQRDHHPLYL